MTQNMTPQKIRDMLNAYYDGMASADDVAALTAYFAGDGPVDDEFSVDREMFRAMAAARADVPDVPADLESRILNVTTRRGRLRVRLWGAIASAAAAVALMIAVWPDGPATTDSPEQGMTVLRLASADNDIPENIPVRTVEKQAAPAPHIAKASRRHAAAAVAPVTEAPSPYIELTDSADVAEITKMVLRKLDTSFAIAVEGMRDADMAIASVNDKINKISKIGIINNLNKMEL